MVPVRAVLRARDLTGTVRGGVGDIRWRFTLASKAAPVFWPAAKVSDVRMRASSAVAASTFLRAASTSCFVRRWNRSSICAGLGLHVRICTMTCLPMQWKHSQFITVMHPIPA